MKKTVLLSLIAALFALQAPVAMATDDDNSNNPQATPANAQHNGWLGVYIRPMPRALAVQLSALMPSGEGILVDQVEPGSPAAQAGILPNDILLRFNDQKLYSPTQLTRLIASSKLGSKAKLEVVRNGKIKIIDSEIASRPAVNNHPPMAMQRPYHAPQQRPLPRPVPKRQAPALAWDSFESVMVKTLPDGRYHAEVSFKDGENNSKSFTFEGNKDEIVMQIRQQKDLPADKRKALLDALDMQPLDRLMPRNPFDDPFFKNRGFDDFFNADPFFNGQGAPFRSPFFDRLMQPQWPQQPPFMQPYRP